MAIEKQNYLLLFPICASLFSMPFMLAGVNALLPEIGVSLNVGAKYLSLVGTAYALGLSVFQLACGSLGDIWGHKRIFLTGSAIFGLSCAAAGFVNDIYPFLLLRFMQGMGCALTNASGLALIASSVEPEKRAPYLGATGASVYAGIACSPPAAGFIASWSSWRWLFFSVAGFTLLFFFWMLVLVSHDWRPAKNQKFDLSGSLMYGLAMLALVIAASQLASAPLNGCLAFAIFILVICRFCKRELSVSFPVLNLRILSRNIVLAFSAAASFANYTACFGIIFYFSFFLQSVKHYTVREAGLILCVQALAQALITPFAARLCKARGNGVTSALGAAICGIGLFAAAFINIDSSLFLFWTAQIFLGAGISFFSLGNTALLLESGGKNFIGQAAALTGAVRTAGQLMSMLIITLTISMALGSQTINPDNLDSFMIAMRSDILIFALLNLCAIGTIFLRNRK